MPKDANTALLAFLRTYYSSSNGDLTTLMRRYLNENPGTQKDVHACGKKLVTDALAAQG